MNRARAALALCGVAVAGVLLVSGGSDADPRTPPALPGQPPPFLGTVVLGGGELTAALDAYGDVVDLRPSPAGPALIENPAKRQAAGTVPADTGIVPRVRIGDGPALPFWRADSIRQRYLAGTNVAVTTARFGAQGFGRQEATLTGAAVDGSLVLIGSAGVRFDVNLVPGASYHCRPPESEPSALVCGSEDGISPARLLARAARSDRSWLARARALGTGAPRWARRLYERSLLTLRALTDAGTGAVAAGARDGWAYVWPRDAATVALALHAAGYRAEARRAARFLTGIDLAAAARFEGNGDPVPGRGPQGDAPGWVALASRATGASAQSGARAADAPIDPSASPDYQEGAAGEYLANAIAAGSSAAPFLTPGGLVRRAGEDRSGLDSAAAWAVRPFPRPALFAAVRKTLEALASDGTPYGITPGEGWEGGEDPWSAPTAWSAWSLAALGERRRALELLADLRRAATPAGALPERVDVRTGVPGSTTPLAWSHAFAILALRELWPAR